jgi:hypothetical protein
VWKILDKIARAQRKREMLVAQSVPDLMDQVDTIVMEIDRLRWQAKELDKKLKVLVNRAESESS